MMNSKLVRTFALALGSAAIMFTGSAQAATRTSSVSVPFQFEVNHKMMPAGEYRVEQDWGTDIASVVNVNTGQRVQVLRPASRRIEGRARFEFTRTDAGYKLRLQ
jgi:hypothetical protein